MRIIDNLITHHLAFLHVCYDKHISCQEKPKLEHYSALHGEAQPMRNIACVMAMPIFIGFTEKPHRSRFPASMHAGGCPATGPGLGPYPECWWGTQ